MAKFLLLLLTLYLVWTIFFRSARPRRRDGGREQNLPPPPERMVACAHCGVFVPESEAVPGEAPDQFFCSEAHRRQAVRPEGKG